MVHVRDIRSEGNPRVHAFIFSSKIRECRCFARRAPVTPRGDAGMPQGANRKCNIVFLVNRIAY